MSNARVPIDRSAAAIGLLTVGAANALYLAGLTQILDPMMSMEPFYIHMAQLPIANIVSRDPGWGPLYALWLKPFVAVFADPLAVYAANLYGLSLSVSILIYLYVLLLTRRVAVAVGAALFFLISDFNVPLASKVSGFALLVILVGLILSELVPQGAKRLSIVALGVLLASYARPELYLAALFLCVAAIGLAYRERRASSWRIALWPAGALAAVLIPGLWIGTPLISPGRPSDRLLLAFREHFAWNWSRWHDQPEYFLSVWEQEFGAATSTLQAVLNNPSAVAHHLNDNLIGTLRFMVGSTFSHYPLLVPATRPGLVDVEGLLISAAVFGGLIVVASRRALRRQMWDRYGHLLFPYAVIAASGLAAATTIYPVPHYLVIPGVLLIVAGALAAALVIPSPPLPRWSARLVAALICLAAVPRPFVLPSAYQVPGSPFKGRIAVARTITDTIERIRSLGLATPVHVMTLTDGIGELLGAGFQEIKVWTKDPQQPLDAFMRDNHVDVVVTLEAGWDSFVVKDPYWTLLQTNPGAAGFTGVPVPDHDTVRIYVRNEPVPEPGG